MRDSRSIIFREFIIGVVFFMTLMLSTNICADFLSASNTVENFYGIVVFVCQALVTLKYVFHVDYVRRSRRVSLKDIRKLYMKENDGEI